MQACSHACIATQLVPDVTAHLIKSEASMQRTAAAPTFNSPLEFVSDLSDQEEPLASESEEDREGESPYINCCSM